MIFDFRCGTCDHVEEKWVKSDVYTQQCSECGSVSNRLVSGGHAVLDPISGDFPGATMKWARHHEQMAKKSSS